MTRRLSNTVLSFLFAAVCISLAGTAFAQNQSGASGKSGASEETNRPLVGAIRWDAWYGNVPDDRIPAVPLVKGAYRLTPNPYPEVLTTLSEKQWRYRLPFFAEQAADGTLCGVNCNRAGIMEQEIEYACRCGLDYWAFALYPKDNPRMLGLENYLKSPERNRIRFCLFVVSAWHFGFFTDPEEQDFALSAAAQPTYLKVQGNRPVFYLGFLNAELLALIKDGAWRRFCAKAEARGLGRPYPVVAAGSVERGKKYLAELFEEGALGQYARADSRVKAGEYKDLARFAETFRDQCAAAGVNVAPICMTGFDRRPRVVHPVSWENFHLEKSAIEYYYKSGTPEQMAEHIGHNVKWLREHPNRDGVNLVLIYAWNEFDEGGWLCPTVPHPIGEGTDRIDAVGKVLKQLRAK